METYICDRCGAEFQDEPFRRDGECLCEECYLEEHTRVCPVCEEHFEPDESDGEHFFITKETSETARKPVGMYRVLKHPFFHGNCVEGFEGFFDGAVEQVNDLDIEAHLSKKYGGHVEVSTDLICPECAAKYKAIQQKQTA